MSTTKVGQRIPSGFSMSTTSSFKSIENSHDLYRGKDCMKKFCKYLREHVMKITKELIHEQRNSKNHIKMQKSVVSPRKTISVKLGTISIT